MLLKIIISSVRPGRAGKPIGDWFTTIAKNNKLFDVEVIDLAEINLPLLDEPEHPRLRKYTKEHTLQWSKIIDEADAFVIVTPEYNFGYPPSLKNALDYLAHEWGYKPVGFVSYGMTAGGTRAVQQLKQIVTALNMMPILEGVVIPLYTQHMSVEKTFAGDNNLVQLAEIMLSQLSIWAKHMKPLREEMHKL